MADFEFKGSGNPVGLVICGGKSSRMGFDKCMISYHSQPECYRVYQLLKNFCSEVYLSCNAKQVGLFDTGYALLPDLPAYRVTGPMAALLTAFSYYRSNDLLVMGCDYPYFHKKDLLKITGVAVQSERPVAYFNEAAGKYEPLLAWYPASAFDKLEQLHAAGHFSLNEFLGNCNAVKIIPDDPVVINSIDTPDEHLKTLDILKHANTDH